MPLEIYYFDFKDKIQQIDYVNLDNNDNERSKTTMAEGILYNSEGVVRGTSQAINFVRKSKDSTNVTSLLSLFTESGLLNFNIVRKYDANYNPINDVITAQATYSSDKYKTGNPVYMKIEPVASTFSKLSILY
jgi:hypothetical protein